MAMGYAFSFGSLAGMLWEILAEFMTRRIVRSTPL
jgi:hypothetical protein